MPADASERTPSTDELLDDLVLRSVPVLGGFKVLEPAVLYAKLGEGGMGNVYLGRHLNLGVDVAVKCLNPELALRDRGFVARFEREARLAASIAHQNVVRVMDVQARHGLHYLVMEYVTGETVTGRVRRKGPLAEREALAILIGATAGLAEAHQRGIVHRDIKPDNLMVSAEGRVKLMDLGLAKAQDVVDGHSLSMMTEGVMGTPQYMPPEQWDTTAVTAAADVWALGATLFYLLAGRPGIPAQGSYLAVGRRIQDADYPTLRGVRTDVRTEVYELLERCVRRDPTERFQDARELLRALRTLADAGEELLHDPATGLGRAGLGMVTPPPRKELQRIRVIVEKEGLGVEPTRIATDAGKLDPNRAQGLVQAAVRATERPRGNRTRVRAALAVGGLAILVAIAYWAGIGQPEDTGRDETDGGKASLLAEGPTRAEGPAPSAPEAAPSEAWVDPEAATLALARAKLALPRAAQLDAAIADLEEALALDPSLTEAESLLAGALGAKSEQLAATDPDAAYLALRRALDLGPGDRARFAHADALEAQLAARLVQGMALLQPAADALFGDRRFPVSGTAGAPRLKALRLAVVPVTRTRVEFPVEFPVESQSLQMIAGRFAAEVEVPADGAWLIVLQGEDENGVRASSAGVLVVVDSEDPAVTIDSPAEGATVGGRRVLAGRVVDDGPCVVTVAGLRVEPDAEGAWRRALDLRDGPQEVVVEVQDQVGRRSRATRSLAVDATAPVLTVTPLPALTNAAEVRVTGTVAGLGRGVLTVDGETVAPSRDGAFAATVPLTRDSTRTVVLVASDAVGNSSEQTVVVRRHTATPRLEWSSPDPSAPLPAGEVEVEGTVVSALEGARVTVNGAPAAVDGATWRARVTLEPGRDLQVVVQAQDAAGNDAAPLRRTLAGRGSRPARIITGIGLTLIFVEPQTFMMGSPEGETGRDADEALHSVTITKGYWLGEMEVTQKQWFDVMVTRPWRGEEYVKEGDDVAATYVSWTDGVEFCRKLTERERGAGRLPAGHEYRLPTEAEWECATRAGTRTAYSFGNAESELGKYAVCAASRDRAYAHKVKSRKPNAWGFYDLHGNVWEWSLDAADWNASSGIISDAYRDDVVDPLGRSGPLRVSRGGCWDISAAFCRSAFRCAFVPGIVYFGLGFRPVLAAKSDVK